MPPKPRWKPAEAQAHGFSMTRFLLPDPTALLGGLAPPRQPGRPKGTVAETRGRPLVFLATAVPMLPGDPVPAKATIAVPLWRQAVQEGRQQADAARCVDEADCGATGNDACAHARYHRPARC